MMSDEISTIEIQFHKIKLKRRIRFFTHCKIDLPTLKEKQTKLDENIHFVQNTGGFMCSFPHLLPNNSHGRRAQVGGLVPT